VLSPGGRHEEFGISKTIGTALDKQAADLRRLLGVQEIGEYLAASSAARPARARTGSRKQVARRAAVQNLPNESSNRPLYSALVARDSVLTCSMVHPRPPRTAS